VSRATIRTAEKELKERAEAVASVRSGGYIKISAEERVKIRGYAARNGVTATLRHFKQTKEYPNKSRLQFAAGKMSIAKN